jgi:signal transduction histidine kinase
VPTEIPKDVALCFFRVAQEALSNVVKHSRAARAQVDLASADNEIRLLVVDAGSGFDADLGSTDVGIGLVGMRERLRLVGGKLSVQSAPQQGTKIIAEVALTVSGHEAHTRTITAGGMRP